MKWNRTGIRGITQYRIACISKEYCKAFETRKRHADIEEAIPGSPSGTHSGGVSHSRLGVQCYMCIRLQRCNFSVRSAKECNVCACGVWPVAWNQQPRTGLVLKLTNHTVVGLLSCYQHIWVVSQTNLTIIVRNIFHIFFQHIYRKTRLNYRTEFY